jgi:lipoprotein-anchoring transpeptidase ErfK/SrfK
MKWLKALAVAVVIMAAVVATVFTCGAAGAAIGTGVAIAAAASAAAAAGGAAIAAASTALIVTASVLAGAVVVGSVTESIALKVRQDRNKEEAKAVRGRDEEIPEGYERKEKEESRQITHDLAERYIIKDSSKNTAEAIIVPDYQVN